MDSNVDKTIEDTAEFWSSKGVTVSSEDAREMIHNIAGFITVLSEWEAAGAAGNGV